MGSQDKRRAPRLPVSLPVVCEVEGQPQQFRSLSLSQGEMLLTPGVPAGATVRLRFRLARAGESELKGQVRHGSGETGGVEFVELTPDQQDMLKSFLDSAASSALAGL